MEAVAEAVELTRNATCPGDHDQAWELVLKAALDTDVAFGRATGMLEAPDLAERKVGCDLLGVLAELNESLREPVLFALLPLAERESDHDVQAAMTRALGVTRDERAVPALLRLAAHPSEDVRAFVAWSLPIGAAGQAVIDVLIGLSEDPDDDVRNWATFALGTQCQVDAPEIRAALWARVDDEHSEVREEAINGLARRRDRRIVPRVARLLDGSGVSFHTFTAVACLGDPALLPHLDGYEDAAEALRECDPRERAARDAFAADLAERLHERLPYLDFGVNGELCEPGLTLAARGVCWSVEALRERAYGDPSQAAELVAGDLEGAP